MPTSIWSHGHASGHPDRADHARLRRPLPDAEALRRRGEDLPARRAGRDVRRLLPQRADAASSGLMDDTVFYEETRFLDWSGLHRVPRPRAAVDAVSAHVNARGMRVVAGPRPAASPTSGEPASDPGGEPARHARRLRRAPPGQRRAPQRARPRLAISQRVYDIDRDFGVSEDVLRRVHIAATHIADIPAQEVRSVEGPVRFVTLAGCASREKGTDVILGALEPLKRARPRPGRLPRCPSTAPRAARVRDALPALPRRALGRASTGPSRWPTSCSRASTSASCPSIWEEAYGFVGVEMIAGGLPVIGNARRRHHGLRPRRRDGLAQPLAATATGWPRSWPRSSPTPAQVPRLNR